MSHFGSTDWFQRVTAGGVKGSRSILRSGVADVTTDFMPITDSGFYRMPETPAALEVVSDNAADTFLGIGARQIAIEALDQNFDFVTHVIDMDGTTPVALPADVMRVTFFVVLNSGTYANAVDGSHQGEITLREVGGGQAWSLIKTSPAALGNAMIGCFSVPAGKVAFGLSLSGAVSAAKVAEVALLVRLNAASPVPYGARVTGARRVGITGEYSLRPRAPIGPIAGPADFIVVAKVTQATGIISSDLNLVIADPL